MSAIEVPEMSELQRQYDKVVVALFLRGDAAFYGPLLCGLQHVWDYTVETAETDGKTLWWNPEDFMRCTPEEREATVMHELKHVALMHNLRRAGKDAQSWNTACDIKINRDMIRDKFKIENSPMFIHIPQITAEAEEDIYEIVKQNPPPPPKGSGGKPGSGPCGPKCNHAAMADKMDQAATIANVVKAIQSAEMSGNPGAIPGNLKEIVSNFLTPIIPWEVELKEWMTDLIDYDYTWARPNRRYPDMYLPSMIQEDGRLKHVVHFQDVSGSIQKKDTIRFNSELKFVWDILKPEKMTVIQFDTCIQKIDEFIEGDEFTEIEIIGRGGTSLVDVRQWIIDNKPTAVTIFTDMQVAPMAPLPFEVPILWICTNNAKGKVPFGKLIHIQT